MERQEAYPVGWNLDLSALDNLIFFGRMKRLSGKEARVQAIANLERVGLLKRANEKVERFSTGMKRRVNLGGKVRMGAGNWLKTPFDKLRANGKWAG